MSVDPTFSRSPEAISCELDTGAAILDSRTNFYFALNSTGALVWDRLPANLNDIVSTLAAQFGVERDLVARDVSMLLDQLAQHNLVVSGEAANADEAQTA